MFNARILAAWPNWLIVPLMLAMWIAAGVLLAETLGGEPYTSESQ
jgi:hypothetical protein